MTRAFLPGLLLLGSLLCVVGTEEIDYGTAQIEWLRSKGGFFSSKVGIQRLFPEDPSSPRGLFATQDIHRGEMLVIVPKKCLLTAGGNSTNVCRTVRNLMNEYKLGDKSEFEPYVQYMFSQKAGTLPSAWSKLGKKLLHKVYGRQLLRVGNLTNLAFKRLCKGTGDAFEETAFLLLRGRSWDDKLVPVYDMINHRRGRWANVDSNSAHRGRDIFAFATRDIKVGEQLHFSYYECTDCPGYSRTYVTQHMVRDFGFVEQYPQRWKFFVGEPALLFDLDDNPDSGELTVTWQSAKPNINQVNKLRGHLRRIRDIGSSIYEESELLISSHERRVILEVYGALKTALQHAIWYSRVDDDSAQDTCLSLPNDTAIGSCTDNLRRYDDLEERKDPLQYDTDRCSGGVTGFRYVVHEYDHVDHMKSQYQTIDFYHNREDKDMCLFLNKWLQACTSFRPHYHEVFVHYPARFTRQMKRVIYLGGGDNMILHEIIKHKSLELIVGLELDQQVVRSSFKNLGTQPHFDKEKVHWWFGDAAKSLLMLPKEYYGSFDLVLVDLQTAVVEKLKVTNDLTIMDVAVLLMSPDGIIVRNEDFVPRKGLDFADCTVDINYADLPIVCEQSITLGSNSIDFLSHKPINHDVDTLFFKRFQEGDDHFEMWYNYGKNSTRTNKLCKVPGGQNIDILQGTETSSGALMVIDVEEINSPLDDSAKEAIVDAVKKAGLTITDEVSQGRTLLLILQEGYVFARTFPERRYCAFDVQLWSSFAKQSVVEKELVAGLESKVSSSYRIVTGGMFSESISQDNKQKSGPRVTATCSEFPGTDNAKVRYIDDAVVRAVVAESVALLSLSGGVIAVICGMDSLPCLSFDAVQEATGGDTAFAVGTCSGVTDLKAWPQDNMVACEDVTKQILQQHVQRLGRISSLVLDPGVPLAMGRILHKLFSDAVFRRKIIADDSYAIVSPILDSSQSWRRELLERFRTDFEVFAPSLRAQVFVSGTNSTLELGLFSSGDSNFYSRLAGSLPRIRAATGLSAEVRHVKNGVLDFRPDFEPSIYASFSDFDSSSSLEQWLSQKPLGQQAIIHTDVKGVKFSAGDKILIDVDSQWYSGRILKARGNSKFDVIYSRDGEKENGVKKERIRFQEGQEPTAVSTSMIKKALESSLESLEVSGAKEILTFEDVGKGCVMAAWWSGGSLVMIWDGRTHLDVNLFTYDEGEEFVDDFERYFADGFSFSLSLSHDIQPRGVGRVVNFRKDLETQEEVPLWVA